MLLYKKKKCLLQEGSNLNSRELKLSGNPIMAYNLMKEYAGKLKAIDWIDHLIRRNPLFYGRAERLFRRLAAASLEERKAWTEERVRLMCRKARETAYGAALEAGEDINEWPYASNTDIRKDPYAFLRVPPLMTAPANTSGTSGVPLKLFRSFQSVAVEQVSIDGLTAPYGCDLRRARIASLKGDNIKSPSDMRPPFWKFTKGGQRLLLSSNHLSCDTAGYYFDILNEFKPDCIFAYPTSIEALGEYLLKSGRKLQAGLVVTSSEVLTARARSVIEEAFGCRVVDYYGQSERVAFAYSHIKNEFYFLPGYAYIELSPVAKEYDSELYEIIGTPLWNTAMPIIRYRTGDLIRVPGKASEEQLERIRYGIEPFPEIVGRTDDWYLDSPDGVRLMGIPHIARDTENIHQMQIIQESLQDVRFLIIPSPDYNEADEQKILYNASLKLPQTMRISIEHVDRPIRTKQGKTPFVIRRWELKEELKEAIDA